MKILKLWSIFMAILFQSAMPADAKVGGIFDALITQERTTSLMYRLILLSLTLESDKVLLR